MDHLDIVKRLCDNNCDTYIVGGGIRDMLLGKNPDDFDVVTEATPDQVINLFKDCKVKQVGKSFGVILVEGYEVATFRHDRYKDSKCIVSFADTIHDDLSRRDLTINAMAFCELTGDLIDDHGGRQDLERRIIRFVGDPDERIDEDPVRMLRACRFLSKINGKFDTNTLFALRDHIWLNKLNGIAPERIRMEILKAMKIKNASLFFTALHSIYALELIFPSLDRCWNHEHGPHHEEDIFEHCMYAGDAISCKDPILKLSGYLHDVGKPASLKDGKFIGHEYIGRNLLKEELISLKFTNDEIQRICGLVRSHMNSIKEMKPKGIRRLLKKFYDRGVEVDDFLRLRMADRRANIARENFTITEWVDMVKKLKNCEFEERPMSAHDLDLSGKEIIDIFGIKPGPLVGEVQRFLLSQVIDDPSLNTKIFLTNLAEGYLGRK